MNVGVDRSSASAALKSFEPLACLWLQRVCQPRKVGLRRPL